MVRIGKPEMRKRSHSNLPNQVGLEQEQRRREYSPYKNPNGSNTKFTTPKITVSSRAIGI